jgi:hypothetical protein
MFSGLLLDPEFICKASDPASDQDPSKTSEKIKKNLDSYCFVTSLKNDVNVPSKRNRVSIKTKRENFFLLAS